MLGKRSLGVAQAGIGLSLLTGLLVVLGYIALDKLAGMGDAPPVEIRDGSPIGPIAGGGGARNSDPDGLRVLTPQQPDSSDVPRTSLRPGFAPQQRLDMRDDPDQGGVETLWPLPRTQNEDFRSIQERTR